MQENIKEKKKKEKDPIGIIYMAKKIYPMCLKAKPSYFIFNQSLAIIHGFSHGFDVFINQVFYDAVYKAATGSAAPSFAFWMLVVYAAANIFQNILNAVHNFTTNANWQRINGFMALKIAEKSSLIDPVEYENPKRLDDINKAANGANSAVQFQFITSTVITFYLPYFIFMSIYLFTLKPLLLLAIVFVFIPTALSQILRSSVFSKLEDESAPLRREFDAYRGAICSGGFIKETRNLGAFGYFRKLMLDALASLNKATWKANVRSNKIDASLRFLSLLGYGGILAMLIYYLLQGEEKGISVGAFAAVYGSIGKVFGIMEEMISRHLGNLANNFGQIRNFLRFLDIPVDERTNTAIPKNSDIVLKDVSFRYPNAERDCISDINLTVRGGETVAIVGENGAGKTTLVRLLTGIYRPVTGEVTIGGSDISKISYRALFEGISGVFQKYQRYKLTLDENVRIADYASGVDISPALEKSGVDSSDKETFPNGADTILSREFEGVDLSGGEWQRVAIARGLYRDSDIIVLDEPTAAIDPLEESAIYRKFIEIAKDKTAVIVTHRMGSARIADHIVVMRDGRIEQYGTHDELLSAGGIYADMFKAQAGWYAKS